MVLFCKCNEEMEVTVIDYLSAFKKVFSEGGTKHNKSKGKPNPGQVQFCDGSYGVDIYKREPENKSKEIW